MKLFKPLFFILFIIGLVALVIAAQGGHHDDATRVLKQAGYTNIHITGYRPLMAGKDDFFSTGFCATSPAGQTVTGAVTGGPFKGNTIRLD